MENMVVRHSDDYLQHHGIKGQRWGIRRYQNKDGSLTTAGQKRYNKEVEKLKKETAKVKAAEKVAANSKKTQAKFDKLEAKKQALEERKKALKSNKNSDDTTGKSSEELLEERRAKLLKSTDAKELYKNKDLLTYQELSDRLNRIDLEARLQNKIPTEPSRFDKAKSVIENATNMYRTVDNAYSAVSNSAIGKMLAKKLGIALSKETDKYDLDDFVKNINKKTAAELKEMTDVLKNKKTILDEHNRQKNKAEADAEYAKKQAEAKQAAKKKAESQKQVDDYNERWRKGESDDKVSSNNDSTANASGKRDTTRSFGIEDKNTTSSNKKESTTERFTSPGDGSDIVGEGTSRSSIKNQMDNGKKWWDTSNVSDTVDYTRSYNDYVNSNSTQVSVGQNRISGLLEGPVGQTTISGLLEDKT